MDLKKPYTPKIRPKSCFSENFSTMFFKTLNERLVMPNFGTLKSILKRQA